MIKAELIDSMGDDLRVVNAARVSFDKEAEWVETCSCGIVKDPEAFNKWPGCGTDERQCARWTTCSLSEKDAKLIRYLASHGHWTPFAHPTITLRETVPIFVARQRFKHMVGFTYNEVSRRYVDSEPELYMPEDWRKRPDGSVKQGSSHEAVNMFDLYSWAEIITPAGLYEDALELYSRMLEIGVCPEQARMVLPQSMMTSYYVTGSLAAFARAYAQRSDAHAQLEIQMLAKEWDKVIRPLFPVSWAALVDKDSI